ncbi:D-galacturonate reductase [Colletotrichum spinosum]|uniref:D-galacturonate reductase n=1 Tax=Colletotrichum spinosum TaxID=1347390 RepID=A0A4R8Q8L4_9PEZI|nr:D-galacturonate reductase [Colletotrichum spinosum]
MPNETPVCEKKYLLNNGQYMPAIYGVEKLVGQAVRESGVPREAVTVVTKFWGRWHHDPGRRAPRAIGVSNFSQRNLEVLLRSAEIVPAVNQVEVHAFCPSLKLVPFCQDKGIHVMGWGSLGGGDAPPMSQILTHEVFEKLARARGCSVAVVHLSWAVQRGITVIPRSSSHSRIDDNIRLITLTADEMSIMNAAQDTIGKHRSTDQLVKEIDGRKTIFGWMLQDFGWEDEYGNWLT